LEDESLKKIFPSLAKELQTEENKVQVNSVRTDQKEAEDAVVRRTFDNYVPGAIDFIRRCDTAVQAEEIIDYMEQQGEINKEHSLKLRTQLREKGVRSFGPKKEQDYYLKRSRQ
jgi:hypothetical protein